VTDTTLDEARRCPKCQELTVKVGEQPAKLRTADGRRKLGIEPGTMLHIYQCQNDRCKWYGETARIIQVNPDGTIPPATTKRDKEFPRRPDLVAQVQASLDNQLIQEVSKEGTAEVRR
jgi:hypothetical protein